MCVVKQNKKKKQTKLKQRADKANRLS